MFTEKEKPNVGQRRTGELRTALIVQVVVMDPPPSEWCEVAVK